ncbi:hypothetical protein BCR42DRAFT_439401 [Absidia repens]|uniref:Uncharacterized protein n=1 Tax=Absidia repens TaxID=90262 RepID=A0A1X2IC54_9FUNG|nr:hypothetical protein BCR42DRAFT_439401 [Absidia repens]
MVVSGEIQVKIIQAIRQALLSEYFEKLYAVLNACDKNRVRLDSEQDELKQMKQSIHLTPDCNCVTEKNKK